MYYLEDLIGSVVTMRTTNGLEIVASLLGYDDEHSLVTFGEPRVIVVNNGSGELALIPYAFTASTESMFVHTQHLVTVLKTGEITETDYLRIVAEANEMLNNVDEEDEEELVEEIEE